MKKTVVLYGILITAMPAIAQEFKPAAVDSNRIKQLFFTGLRDKLRENYSKSNDSFSLIVAADAHNDAAWYEIALLNFRQNKMPQAEEAIKNATSIDPDNLWYWKLLSELYKSTGNMPALIPVFDQLIRLAPEQQSYYYDRASAYFAAGKVGEAKAGYDLVEQKFGSSPALIRARNRMNRGAEQSTPVSDINIRPDDVMAAATQLIAQKKFSSAAAMLANVAREHEQDPLFLTLYADVLYETGNLPAALNYYKKALKVTDQLYGVWEKVLNIHILLGQYKEMITVGENALALYPNQAILYYYMAFAMHREKQNNKALTYVKSALALDGDNRELQALITALQAEILIDERNPVAADRAFERAVSLDPKNYQIMNNYAYYLALRNENLDKAVLLIEKAARALPQDASIADTYALILLKGGRYALARTWIEKALENNEAGNNVYLEHYGDILFLSGEQDKALVVWKKAREAGNESPLLKRKINEKKYIK
jgi:tetratricopeptide (TPR) repeat protein